MKNRLFSIDPAGAENPLRDGGGMSGFAAKDGTFGSYGTARPSPQKIKIQLTSEATYNATQEYNKLISAFTADFTANYIASCLPQTDLFKYEYPESEYHYTLYYYDQAGNLVQTVPPEGVHLLDVATNFNADGVWTGGDPEHTHNSVYAYNSLDLPVKQQTPDGGITRSWYNKKGQLMASQNAKQAATTYADDALVQYKPYSYTRYDELGRTVETGELNVKKAQSLAEVPEAQQELLVNHSEFPNSATINGVNQWELLLSKPKVQVTRTYYDETLTASVNAEFGTKGQEHLRSRVSSASFEEKDDNDDATYDFGTHYSYDPLGNVKTLLQQNTALEPIGHDFKRLDYEYDLVSGNVNEVKYQHGQPDRFYHQYDYDADNRIVRVFSSRDRYIWENDAKYFYYKHGPLARTEIGHDKVQGCDYAYTVQGWIKGMNSNTLKANRDIGKDAVLSGKNAFVGTDALGYTLGYYSNDYAPIGAMNVTDYFEAIDKTSAFSNTFNLFNGNISHVVPAMMKPDETYLDILGNDYRYDQLNRLKSMEEFAVAGLRTSNSWSGAAALTDYKTELSYDANGNITTLKRNAVGAMDDMTYSYQLNTNKLTHVSDAVAAGNYATDIDNQPANNYDYDATGNLIKDEQEEIASIDWNVYGKVQKITRTAGSVKPDLVFKYDATGNRISKTVKPRTASGLTDATEWTTTFYNRDAQGNIMAMYENSYENLGPFEGIRASADFKIKESQRITGGTLYVSISVSGVSIMPSVEWQGDAAATATAAAAAINNTVSSPDYTATSNGGVVTVTADAVGTSYNGYTLSSNINPDFSVEYDYLNNFTGGMNPGTLYKAKIYLKEQPIYGSKRVGIKNSNILLDELSFVANISVSGKEFVNVTEASSQNYVSPGLSSLCGAGERGKGIVELSGPNQSFAEMDVEFFVNGISINQPINWQGPAFTATALANAINSFVSSPDYVAEANGNQVMIYTATERESDNGFAVTGAHTLNWSFTVVSNMAGGKDAIPCERVMGRKAYELTNWLGDVNVTVSDKKIGVDNDFDGFWDGYTGDVLSTSDMYPGGSIKPARNFYNNSYRFGVNMQERVEEIAPDHYTAEFWEYDPRSIRRWNKDQIKKPWESPYAVFSNNPILFNDPLGLESMGPEDDFNGNENQEQMANPLSKYGEEDYRTAKESFEMNKFLNTVYRKDVKDLSVSAKGRAFIASWEQGPNGGAALSIYDDKNKNWKTGDPVKGTLTIGYGHKVLPDEDFSKGITQSEAEDLLTSDIETKAVDYIQKLVKVPLSQQEFDALASYVFNVGQGNSLVGTSLIKKLNSKDYAGAGLEMDINKSGGEFMQGLENRRQNERKIWKNGTYTNHQ